MQEYRSVTNYLLFIRKVNSLTELTFFTVVKCLYCGYFLSTRERKWGHIIGHKGDYHVMSHHYATSGPALSHLKIRWCHLIGMGTCEASLVEVVGKAFNPKRV